MVVFTMATASVPRVSVIEGGLHATVHNFIVMTYITVLVMDSAWVQTSANASRDFL